MPTNRNWKALSESQFPWEQDALDFIRDRFPAHEPYHAWSNFEFIADDGGIYEVDLLVFSPQGFFLVEIKSRPGHVRGDAGTWVWEHEGRIRTIDNPLKLANSKAKKLRSLLQRQKAFRRKGSVPFLEALVFCSAPDLRCDLRDRARYQVCLRDREASADKAKPARPGIMAALKSRQCDGLQTRPKDTLDRPTARLVAQALDQAGIRRSQRHRKVGDYLLEDLLGEGPGYQDWQATHTSLQEVRRRVRIYNVRSTASEEDRSRIERAARREAELLETLQHPGILRREGYTQHELGPALIFEHDPTALRLDHFLAQRANPLDVERQLDLLRQIAEVVRFAHDRKVVHRGLCPRSILVTQPDSDRPGIKIYNWQVGYRSGSSAATASHSVSATSHVDELVEDLSTAYMAPEALSREDNLGEHLDVFSLGALAYLLFSGQPPAANGLELNEKLREDRGLQISAVLNGACESMQELIQWSTHPEVAVRIDSVTDFLEYLDQIESQLLADEHDVVQDPTRAQIGDQLPGGYKVVRRLGQGACSVALLVERGGQDLVLKVASDPDNNPRLQDEAEVLRKQELRHAYIVDCVDTVQLGDRFGFLMRPAFADKEKRLIETLGHRIRREGRMHVDLLQRFGADLLDVVNHLEEQGIPHRDIKPDNIAVGKVGRGDRLHLVLFDFSLSRAPADNIRVGTTGYLDPLLALRKPPRWDLHAERYAAAMTLYELATGTLAVWGDDVTDPSHLECEITIDGELIDASLRDRLSDFFRRAFRRNPAQRFDNAEQMRSAWRHGFEQLDPPSRHGEPDEPTTRRQQLDEATAETPIPELGLSTSASNVLDQENVLRVSDLLVFPLQRLPKIRGVGNDTRREIAAAAKVLRSRLGVPDPARLTRIDTETRHESEIRDVATVGVDILARHLAHGHGRDAEAVQQVLQSLLGLDPRLPQSWPSQSEVAQHRKLTRLRAGQLVARLQQRWSKDPAVTRLRTDIAAVLAKEGGVMTSEELARAILAARGSYELEPMRTRLATAVVRAAVEVEQTLVEPRFLVHREDVRVLIAQNQQLAKYAAQWGDQADLLADEDPLVPPSRAIQRLREVPQPNASQPNASQTELTQTELTQSELTQSELTQSESPQSESPQSQITQLGELAMLTDGRLLRLAAAASRHAVVSSRQELYPRGMDGGRALKLAHGALYGVPHLTVAQIHDRVRSRYPESAALPDRPLLDQLLEAAGFALNWQPGTTGHGSYVPHASSESSPSADILRRPTANGSLATQEITAEDAAARQFEERLQRSVREGSFLALTVDLKHYDLVCQELCRRFPLQRIDVEGLFIESLRQVADGAGAKWPAVVGADATPGEGNWDKFLVLVNRAIPILEQQLDARDQTMLLTYSGVLARYDQMALLERLRDKVGRRDGIHGVWLLLPGDQPALLDGRAVPIISPGQRAIVPTSWIENRHRS